MREFKVGDKVIVSNKKFYLYNKVGTILEADKFASTFMYLINFKEEKVWLWEHKLKKINHLKLKALLKD